MQPDELITFFFLANIFFSPITVIGNQYNQGLLAMAGAERIFRLIDTQPDWQDAPGAEELPNSRVRLEGGIKGARVEFRGVSFGYNPERLVLHDISFVAEPGQTIALVGHTGSGKSSIINLVSKFYLPTSGEVLVDGREIRRITSSSLHRQMGMVQQQNFLFSGSVLENIRLSKPGATADEVRAGRRAPGLPGRPRRAPGGPGHPGRRAGDRGCPSVSASSCASSGHSSPTRGSSSSTRRRAPSTP